jgi:hypothetical protein
MKARAPGHDTPRRACRRPRISTGWERAGISVVHANQDAAAKWLLERRDLAERRATIGMIMNAALLAFIALSIFLSVISVCSAGSTARRCSRPPALTRRGKEDQTVSPRPSRPQSGLPSQHASVPTDGQKPGSAAERGKLNRWSPAPP